uniref:Uncharacterized protein n=1 Tax=mine drainage metagenome TaxID=410659 RepID=E6Q0S4_9ZZZZ
MTEAEVTIQHEASHIAIALFCGIGVLGASIVRASDGNPDGVKIASAGSEAQTRYSWCMFYRFPYHWETDVLGESVDSATFSCSKDLANFAEVAESLWSGKFEEAKLQIDKDCKRILKYAFIARAIEKFSAAFRNKPILTQSEIYDLWTSLIDTDSEANVKQPKPGS